MEQKEMIFLIIVVLAFIYFFTQKESFEDSCDKKACNAKMREFMVDNGWSFKDSTKLFKECQHCDSKWYRNTEFKVSDNGSKWTQYKSHQEAYDAIKF